MAHWRERNQNSICKCACHMCLLGWYKEVNMKNNCKRKHLTSRNYLLNGFTQNLFVLFLCDISFLIKGLYCKFDLLYCSLLHMKFLHVLENEKQCLKIHDIKTMERNESALWWNCAVTRFVHLIFLIGVL